MTRPDTTALAGSVAAFLSAEVGSKVDVGALERLSGGASRETWAIDATWDGLEHPLVLRLDPPGAVGGDRATEMSVLDAARKAGVPAPEVLCGTTDPAVLGAPFFIMERIEGETIPRKLLRDEGFAAARPRLVRQCAEALAHIHAVDISAIEGLAAPETPESLVLGHRVFLDAFGEPHPALELGMAWLISHLPEPVTPRLVHGDFRNGNLLVGQDGLRAVLDWELAHLGDPMEDLGWMCVRSWRFGEDDKPAGGFGAREELFAAYEAAGGGPTDPERVRFWEAYGTLRWGVICVAQAAAHLQGARRSVELAAIGRRTCEMEYDLLELITGKPPSVPGTETRRSFATGQDRPTLGEAADAIAGWIEDELLPELTGRDRFLGRVAANLLRIMEREVELGSTSAKRDRTELARLLGHTGPVQPLEGLLAEMVTQIRVGAIAPEGPVLDVMQSIVARKLLIANPGYLAVSG